MATIDERLEALAMNLEMLSHTVQETAKIVNMLGQDQAKTEEMLDKLVLVARSHDARIGKLENK